MRLSRYTGIERAIVHGEGDQIFRRWRWGQVLLHDPKRVTENGHLRHGALATLIEYARSKGYNLSEREIRYRLQAARTYATEAEIGSAAADFETWRALCDAGFPPSELDDPGEPFDPRWDSEKSSIEQIRRRIEEEQWQEILPGFDPFITLAEVQKRTQREAALALELQALIDAVDGDLSATWEEAQQALHGDDPDDTEPDTEAA